MSAEAELLDPVPLAARHSELMREFAAGVAGACIALWKIREERTYIAQGFKSYTDFVKSIHLSAFNGRLYANSGPVILELRTTGDDVLVTHVDLLRPIALLLSPQKQDEAKQRSVIARIAQIVRVAAQVAKRGMEPLTEDVVQRVAKSNFGILPREEWRAQQRKKKASPAIADEKRRKELVKAVGAAISALAYWSEDIRSGKLIDLEQLRSAPGFEDAMYLLKDAREV